MQPAQSWGFPPFRLDAAPACLWRGDQLIALRPKPLAVLVHLVAHAGEVVSKAALLDAVWPETAVGDDVLRSCIRQIRRALEDAAESPRFIATLHRRGYRFIAPVAPVASSVLHISATTLEPLQAGVSDDPPKFVAERRQLTILFCDLVESTRLAGQLDPEDWREVLQAYHLTCAEVVARFEGYVAQYLGDGVLVYFGYPVAHEDDAQRAVWSGLELLEAIEALNARLALPSALQMAVRLGLHTGLVVVSNVGTRERQEPLAQGETPHIAARLQSLAGPHELVISGATRDLLGGVFDVTALGEQELQGVAAPMPVYRVERIRTVESRFEAMSVSGLTRLVGREEELELLWRRWQQATEGEGQVVLLCGDAGLGKSRLTQALCERLADEPHLRILYQGSPYHTNSAFYPIIAHLEHTLALEHVCSPSAKLDRLETLLTYAGMAVEEVAPLLAALLSTPSDDRYAPLTQSAERRKEQTIEALVAQLVHLSQRQPVLLIFEDAHWSDPSTLEMLDRFIDGLQTVPVLAVITYRPAFEPRWRSYGHVTTHTLNRLTRRQVTALIADVTNNKALPQEVLAQIEAKTDGVPLFVEELTKMVLESGLLKDHGDHYALSGPLAPLAIPATLQDSLMARLDRLESAKAVAQYASVIGRQVSYTLLEAVSPLDEATLQHELGRLVRAELLYQRGLPPQAMYTFKHVLIQDSAYQSLLRSTKQGYHQRIAEVLETQFAETVETQPELLALHYTEAGLTQQAIGYWQRAGEKAVERSANAEAIAHLHTGLELLQTLPDSPERARQELTLHLSLAVPLVAIKGQAASEVESVYIRARDLCQQVGDTSQLIPVLWGLYRWYGGRAEYRRARAMVDHLMRLAAELQDPLLYVGAHRALGAHAFYQGEFVSARTHLEQSIAHYASTQQHSEVFHYATDHGVTCRALLSWTLWVLGYPDQAAVQNHEMLALAQNLSHLPTLAFALEGAALFHQFRREIEATQQQARAILLLASEQGFTYFAAVGQLLQGWAQRDADAHEASIKQMHQGLAAHRATEIEIFHPYFLGLLADVYGRAQQTTAGLTLLIEALALVDKTGQRFYEAELYRLKGELLRQQTSDNHTEAESCFQQALVASRSQQAKSLELRAATSLAQLWQRQGKREEAERLLGHVYGWFTEGFDTADLMDAKALLDALTPSAGRTA